MAATVRIRDENGNIIDLPAIRGRKGDKGDTGADGKSAYEVAKDNGFEGTEAEWLDSLKGTGNSGGISYESDPTVPSWAKEPNKPTYDASEISYTNEVYGEGNMGEILDSMTSDFSGAIEDIHKNYAETSSIPTTLPASDVHEWAKQPEKPVYTAAEVGALPDTTVIPTKTSQLENDNGYAVDGLYNPNPRKKILDSSNHQIDYVVIGNTICVGLWIDPSDETVNIDPNYEEGYDPSSDADYNPYDVDNQCKTPDKKIIPDNAIITNIEFYVESMGKFVSIEDVRKTDKFNYVNYMGKFHKPYQDNDNTGMYIIAEIWVSASNYLTDAIGTYSVSTAVITYYLDE